MTLNYRIELMLCAEESYIQQGIRDGILRDFAVLIAQREDDKQAMADALEALERYQVKRQDFDSFHDIIPALRARIDLERMP